MRPAGLTLCSLLALALVGAAAPLEGGQAAATRCPAGELRVDVGPKTVCVERPARRVTPAGVLEEVLTISGATGFEQSLTLRGLGAESLRLIVAHSLDSIGGVEERAEAAGLKVEKVGERKDVGRDSIGGGFSGEVRFSGDGTNPEFAGISYARSFGDLREIRRCPAANGDVEGTVTREGSVSSAADRADVKFHERREMIATLSAEGHVRRNARLHDFDARMELVVRDTGTQVNQGTGQETHLPTRVHRLLYEQRGIDPRGDIWRQFQSDMVGARTNVRGWGPSGRLGGSETATKLFAGLISLGVLATQEAAADLLKAERVWYDDMGCVKLDASAVPMQLDPNERARVSVTARRASGGGALLRGLDGGYDASASAGATVDPGQADAGSRALFRFRAPARRWKASTPPTLTLLLTSRAGRAREQISFGGRSGIYRGRGEGNVCIELQLRGDTIRRIAVGGAPECGHRFACSGRLGRSAPGWTAGNIALDRDGGFRYVFDQTMQPPRPGPPPRRIATTIDGRVTGDRARGTFRTLFEAGPDDRCDSGTLNWTARRVR